MFALPSSLPVFLVTVTLALYAVHVQALATQKVITTSSEEKVPVTLGVMSRCPDALLCESVFDEVLGRVGSKVDLNLSFIGKLNSSDSAFGVTCLHGPFECAGNVQELCAAKYLDQKTWWQYVKCQNFRGRDKIGTPSAAIQCAKATGWDWEGSDVAKCAGEDGNGQGEEGVQLLKESVKASQRMHLELSCTIVINGQQRCIHDGDWKQCDDGHTAGDFVRQINEEYEKLNGQESM